MKVWKLEFKGLNESCYCDFSEDVAEYITNMDIGDEIKISCEDMDEEDYENLPEFEGI